MNGIKILNILAVLFIFTPFFKMCDGGASTEVTPNTDSTAVFVADSIIHSLGTDTTMDSSEMAKEVAALDTFDRLMSIEDSRQPESEKSAEGNFFQRTIKFLGDPQNDLSITGFGYLIDLISGISAGFFGVWIGEITISLSVLLTVFSLFLVLKKKVRFLPIVYLLNGLLVVASFIMMLLILEKFSQIKWGFYSYSMLILTMLVLSFRMRKIELQEGGRQ